MKAWLRKHSASAIVVGIAIVWLLFRKVKAAAGHATPEDAISYGWVVLQAGITGWLEISPDGNTQIMHDTGWTGDPYQKAG